MTIPGSDSVEHFYKMKKLDEEGRQVIMKHVDCTKVTLEEKVFLAATTVVGAGIGTAIAPGTGTFYGGVIGFSVGSVILGCNRQRIEKKKLQKEGTLNG